MIWLLLVKGKRRLSRIPGNTQFRRDSGSTEAPRLTHSLQIPNGKAHSVVM